MFSHHQDDQMKETNNNIKQVSQNGFGARNVRTWAIDFSSLRTPAADAKGEPELPTGHWGPPHWGPLWVDYQHTQHMLSHCHTAKSPQNITEHVSVTRDTYSTTKCTLVTARRKMAGKHGAMPAWCCGGMGLTGAAVSALSEHLADGSGRPVPVISIGLKIHPGWMEAAAFLIYPVIV